MGLCLPIAFKGRAESQAMYMLYIYIEISKHCHRSSHTLVSLMLQHTEQELIEIISDNTEHYNQI